MSVQPSVVRRLSMLDLIRMKAEGQKISMLTCYDASFAGLLDAAGVECLLIGDSLGMVLQGHDSTLPVTSDDMVYHTRAVARGSRRALVVADMPFGTCQVSPQETFHHAARYMAAGANMVKIEGGEEMLETVRFLTRRGIPVCGHLGLTPQSVNQLGGYRVQGREAGQAEEIKLEAQKLVEAGISLLVLEAIPAALAREITDLITVPTIGIGAGADTSGQVLVLHDMLDITQGKKPRFVRNFMQGAGSIREAVEAYVRDVRAGVFPALEHTY